MFKNWTMTLRLIFGVGHILLPFLFGFFASSPWVILPMSFVFVIGYIGGKWYQWNYHIKSSNRLRLSIDVAITWVVQLIVVSLFFFLGLGVGRVFGFGPIAEAITSLDLTVLSGFAVVSFVSLSIIIWGEKNGALDIYGDYETDDDDESEHDEELILSDEKVTIDNFFRDRHWNVSDHMNWALVHWPTEDSKQISRSPVAASETMILDAEQRLGFKLPETLRTLYKIRDGGCLPTYWVPAKENPKNIFDDWIDAFANDYNDLKPLKDLYVLLDSYEEDFDPDYDNEEDKDGWFPNSDKLVVLTHRYGVCTLLDYNKGDNEPGVLLVDLDNSPEDRIRKSYDSFDAFFNDLRVQDEDAYDRGTIIEGKRLSDTGYDTNKPHLFWANSTANSSRGISDENWLSQENRLGFKLPIEFKELYREVDGGVSAFSYHPDLGVDKDGEPISVFPGEMYTNKSLLPVSSWITLQELSNRIHFQGETPYSQLYDDAGRLVVLSGSYDQVLLLDYRSGPEPDILFIPDLMKPDTAKNLKSAKQFLNSLRRDRKSFHDAAPLSDQSLSPRVADVVSFWVQDPELNGVSDDDLTTAKKRFGANIPEQIAKLMQQQNGGMVRFRFITPYNSSNNESKDMFPGGIWPFEKWRKFSDFRYAQKIALNQDIQEDLMPEMLTEPDVTERLIVIGADDIKSLTFLDLSEGAFKSTPYLSRADYNKKMDKYELTISPISIDHYTSGVFALLRAKRDEL